MRNKKRREIKKNEKEKKRRERKKDGKEKKMRKKKRWPEWFHSLLWLIGST